MGCNVPFARVVMGKVTHNQPVDKESAFFDALLETDLGRLVILDVAIEAGLRHGVLVALCPDCHEELSLCAEHAAR